MPYLEPTDLDELCGDLQQAIESAAPEFRAKLAQTIDAYRRDNPDDYRYATGAQAPKLLHYLFDTINEACKPKTIPPHLRPRIVP